MRPRLPRHFNRTAIDAVFIIVALLSALLFVQHNDDTAAARIASTERPAQ